MNLGLFGSFGGWVFIAHFSKIIGPNPNSLSNILRKSTLGFLSHKYRQIWIFSMRWRGCYWGFVRNFRKSSPLFRWNRDPCICTKDKEMRMYQFAKLSRGLVWNLTHTDPYILGIKRESWRVWCVHKRNPHTWPSIQDSRSRTSSSFLSWRILPEITDAVRIRSWCPARVCCAKARTGRLTYRDLCRWYARDIGAQTMALYIGDKQCPQKPSSHLGRSNHTSAGRWTSNSDKTLDKRIESTP